MHERSEIDQIIRDLGFNRTYSVRDDPSVAAHFPVRRCGIYILHFENNQYYVGQAVNVVRRYSQHRRDTEHSDIVRISFRSVRKRNLTTVERETIAYLDKKVHLRNKTGTEISYSQKTILDDILPPTEGARWLSDTNISHLIGDRPNEDSRLRLIYNDRFESFLKHPSSHEILHVLRTYVQKTIPVPKQTERRFWVCTCPIMGSSEGYLLRINVGRQMTFEARLTKQKLFFRWLVPTDQTSTVFGNRISRLLKGHSISPSGVTMGSPHQVSGRVKGTHKAMQILTNEEAILVFRRFNIGLMQKGASLWYDRHCYALADHLLE